MYNLRKFAGKVISIKIDKTRTTVGTELYYTISFDSLSKMAFNVTLSIIGWGGINSVLNALGYTDEVISGNKEEAGNKVVEDVLSKYSSEISMLLNAKRIVEISKDSLIQKRWEEIYGCSNPGGVRIHNREDLINKLGKIYDYYGWDKNEIKDKFKKAKRQEPWLTYIDEIPKEYRGKGFYEFPW